MIAHYQFLAACAARPRYRLLAASALYNGDDRNGRKMIAWGRRIGCADAGHVFDADRRKVATRLVVDDANPSQKTYLLELVDNPAGVRAIVPA